MSAPMRATEPGTMTVVRSSRTLTGLLRATERRAIYLANRARMSRTAVIAAAVWVLVFVVLVLVMPRPSTETRTVVLPEQRTIVIQEPRPLQPEAPKQLPIEKLQVRTAAELPEGLVSQPDAIPDRRIPKLAPDAGKLGRKRAEEATRALASATRSVDQALAGLSSTLKNSSASGPDAQRAAATVRGGRGEGDVRGGPALASSGASAAGRAVQGSKVVIEAPAPVAASDPSAGEGESVSLGEPPGIYRSNASLLGVIQRYAPGIQFCYENELKKKSHLGGKLVVSITVAAAGDVMEARVVNDGVGSAALSSCALAQIKDWKFPAIRRGLTTFQTPFVFTPPN
jgi:TonB family protein